MGKIVRLHSPELLRAVAEGADCLIVGHSQFLLVRVEEAGQNEYYDVTDPVEVELVEAALADTSPVLSEANARAYLKAKLGEHGIG